VIGRGAKRVAEDQALDHVFGYTILWDFSQRDPWGKGKQNTRNVRKGFDTFTGLGPWIVTRDEIDDPQNLAIRVEQNGAPVMSAHTGDMICTLREHIRFLSEVATLAPGVLVSTGTPAGVARLAPGDRLKGSIERIGEMEMAVQAERS
jgi:2-keto-4-pentenoate hydratase/2-oxohepta-3-ene-1,7-dioic acid hydratase in catechol pathway